MVQVVILAEDNEIRDKLAEHDIVVQTISDVSPIEVQPARVLSHLYTYLGINYALLLFYLVTGSLLKYSLKMSIIES